MTRRELIAGSLALTLQGKQEEAVELIEKQTSSGDVSAANLYVRNKAQVLEKSFGKAGDANAVYLLASITKPMTASAVMMLVDRKEVALTDAVQKFVPEFQHKDVTVKHLLTHTSGLPDMPPENVELRKRHAPLSEFVAGTCKTPLLFKPGSEVRYQSMGILVASEIVRRTTKQDFPKFLQERLYRPLGMKQTSLGLGNRSISQTMQVQVDEHNDWDWNSSYWRNLGSPWGGAHASAGDIGRFLQFFSHPDAKVLKPETARQMITEQTPGMKQRWGLGWSLDYGKVGKALSSATYGHGGSTGTLSWHDPQKELTFVLLTTKPADKSSKTLLYPAAEMISATA